jgi:carbonic anhydrase/SulP family sulfate permease
MFNKLSISYGAAYDLNRRRIHAADERSVISSTLPRDIVGGRVSRRATLVSGGGAGVRCAVVLGVLAGIVGSILVGLLSGSQTSVSGPAAGLTVIVAAQILSLGSFPAFLLAVVLAGLIQIGLGLARAGFIAAFFPTSVIKGLLADIGVILI